MDMDVHRSDGMGWVLDEFRLWKLWLWMRFVIVSNMCFTGYVSLGLSTVLYDWFARKIVIETLYLVGCSWISMIHAVGMQDNRWSPHEIAHVQ